jgi:F0F1-type ATP synthase assembly protein I
MIALVKISVSAVLIWVVTEVGKRSGKFGGLILSLPLTSIIVISWLWYETRDPVKIASISTETLVFIVPSLVFFIVLSGVLNRYANFYFSFAAALISTLLTYALFFKLRGDV